MKGPTGLDPRMVREVRRSLRHEIGELARGQRQSARAIKDLVPLGLAEAPCFIDRTGVLRYQFGQPLDIGEQKLLGTHMFLQVDHLYRVLIAAKERLPADSLDRYLSALRNPDKHRDLLAEFAPILRLDPGQVVEYEKPGLGEGQKLIDWLVSGQTPILLDVKARMGDAIKYFENLFPYVEMHPDARPGDEPEPSHDHDLLFRSLADKFRAQRPSDCLQGGWIITGLQQNKEKLHESFNKLDPEKVHFAVLHNGEPKFYLLARDGVPINTVKAMFKIERSDGSLVFVR